MAGRVMYWGSGSFPCWRAMVVLEEKNLKYESKLINFSKQEHKSEEIKAINPRGQVPTFKDGDAVVNESIGIMQYLEEFYPEPALMPSEKKAKAKALQIFFETQNFETMFRMCLYATMFDKDEAAFNKGLEKLKGEIPIWDDYLSKSEYLTGADFTLADATLGTMLMTGMRFGASFDAYPNIKKYANKLKERPSFVATWPPHWKEGPAPNPFLAGVL